MNIIKSWHSLVQSKKSANQNNRFKNHINLLNFNDSFISFSVNSDGFEKTSRNRLLSLKGKGSEYIHFGIKEEPIIHYGNKNKDFELKNPSPEVLEICNQAYQNLFTHIIETSKNYIRPKSELVSDLSQENKSLEWLKVSLLVLKNAIQKTITEKDYIYQGKIFFGVKEGSNQPELRIISLSLDMKLDFMSDHRLRLQVWNLKEGGSGTSQGPGLFSEFVTLKGPVFDEIIALLETIFKVVKV